MTKLATLLLTLLLTGGVHAAPVAQGVQALPVEIPDWLAGFGIGSVVLYLVYRIIASIAAARAPAGATDALIKLADNQAEAIKLDRERFEAQKADDRDRNKNVEALIEQLSRQNERMHNSEAAQMRATTDQIKIAAEEAAAKQKLAESINAMNTEDTRHNKEIETRLTTIENTMGQMKADINLVKLSVGPNAAGKLDLVEKAFARLSTEFHALVTALEDNKSTLEVTEVTHEETTITVDTVSASAVLPADAAGAGAIDAGAGADAGGHA